MTSVVFFVFNDTATTENYTYGHTLSLHDALPICAVPSQFAPAAIKLDHLRISVAPSSVGARRPTVSYQTRAPPPHPHFSRSAEHTSELQSLMRISYAVFCLKKKKHLTPSHVSHYNKSYAVYSLLHSPPTG